MHACGRRSGMALVSALLLLAIVTLLLSVGITHTQTSLKAARASKYDIQAANVARAGLTDAINWFKGQSNQPVQQFAPAYEPTLGERAATNDPYQIDPGGTGSGAHLGVGGLGIVREFVLDAQTNLYARYEVGKVTRLQKDARGQWTDYSLWDADRDDWVSASALSQADTERYEGVRDVSRQYGLNANGLVWRLHSHGYVYRRGDSFIPSATSARFYQYPNQVLEHVELVTEIRRLDLRNFSAALYAKRGSDCVFENPGNVLVTAPNGFGVKYNVGTGDPSPASPPVGFSATNGRYQPVSPANPLGWADVFGVDNAESMAAIADNVVTDLATMPARLPGMAITYIKPASGLARFTQGRPLNGGGILVVDGDLELAPSSASTFSGFLYVTGRLTQASPSSLVGAVVAVGGATLRAPSDKATVEYNADVVEEVRRQLGQYRERGSAVKAVAAGAGAPSL